MSDTLSVCMIVRNEAGNLRQCLDSAACLSSETVIVDTGSTDDTLAIAASYGARVIDYDFTFVDFAAARNYAVECANGRSILMLDADERLLAEDALLIEELAASDQSTGYYLERRNLSGGSASYFTDYVVRLFPKRPEYRYRGRVHETIDASILAAGGRLQKTAIRIDHQFANNREIRRRKNLRYIEILKQEIAADPGDISRLDFLAAEYHQLEMFAEATAVAEYIAQIKPHDPRAHLFAGIYQLRFQPDLPRARAHFERA